MNTSSDKNLPDLPLSFDNDQTVETEILLLRCQGAWSCMYFLKGEFVKYATVWIFINVVADKLLQKWQKCEIQVER